MTKFLKPSKNNATEILGQVTYKKVRLRDTTVNDAIQTFVRRCKEYSLSLFRVHARALKPSDLLFKINSRIKEKLLPSAVMEIASQACRIRREIGHGVRLVTFALTNPSL